MSDFYCQRWENLGSQRYYWCHLGKDMLNDWVLTVAFGGINSKLGAVKLHYCVTLDNGLQKIKDIAKQRHRSGYHLMLHNEQLGINVRQ